MIILGFLLKKYLQGIIKKHAYIESTKVEEKEIYNLGSEVELSIYAESLSIDKKPISTNKSFYESNPKVSSFYEDLSIKNIHWDAREKKFVISVKRGGLWFKARAKALSDAIEKRDELLKESKEFIQSLK